MRDAAVLTNRPTERRRELAQVRFGGEPDDEALGASRLNGNRITRRRTAIAGSESEDLPWEGPRVALRNAADRHERKHGSGRAAEHRLLFLPGLDRVAPILKDHALMDHDRFVLMVCRRLLRGVAPFSLDGRVRALCRLRVVDECDVLDIVPIGVLALHALPKCCRQLATV